MGPHAGNRTRPAYSGQPRFRFPKQIVQLFAPRKPLDFKPPPRKKRLRPLTGLAHFLNKFDSAAPSSIPSDAPRPTPIDEMHDGVTVKIERTSNPHPDTEQQVKLPPTTGAFVASTPHPTASDTLPANTPSVPFETPARRRQHVKQARQLKVTQIVAAHRQTWDPFKGSDKTTEAYNTLFVSNIPYTAINERLHDEFEAFGPVRKVVMPKDRDGVPRGYAFVEFERERDANIAVRQANGLRFEGRRLLVDVERGRTVKAWYPNRLDGPNNSCARRLRKDKREVR